MNWENNAKTINLFLSLVQTAEPWSPVVQLQWPLSAEYSSVWKNVWVELYIKLSGIDWIAFVWLVNSVLLGILKGLCESWILILSLDELWAGMISRRPTVDNKRQTVY